MRGVANPQTHAGLSERKQELERELRARFDSGDKQAINALPIVQAYRAYYRRFKQSYHVQGQLESIVFRGKDIPNVSALVEAMFMAELKNLLLTAGHDLDTLQLPIVLDASNGEESYTRLQGDEQALKVGEMFMRDQAGVISSILLGPDKRTRITGQTRNVLFAVYAPASIERGTVEQHLEDIRQNVLLISPEANSDLLDVFGA
jgi:DNA/RNA-binding domain of Phe-tRNA-synthetase-like protein